MSNVICIGTLQRGPLSIVQALFLKTTQGYSLHIPDRSAERQARELMISTTAPRSAWSAREAQKLTYKQASGSHRRPRTHQYRSASLAPCSSSR